MLASRTIFLHAALMASGYALSSSADLMMGSSSLMAVLGRPLRTASSTFFHCSGRWDCAEATISPTPRATHARETPRATRRFDRVMGTHLRRGNGEARAL